MIVGVMNGARAVFVALAGLLFAGSVGANEPDGKKLFNDPRKGNCIACHATVVDPPAAIGKRIGPSLVGTKSRYPDRAKLRDIIFDAAKTWPNTIMPPYGRHRILNDREVDAVIAYVETL